MGAWAVGVFDNDDAIDWMSELANANDLAILDGAIDAATSVGNYLELPEASRLLCACEVITALGGQPAKNLPNEVLQWVTSHEALDIAALIPAALQVIDRVLNDNSELNQLWQENEDEYSTWRETVLSIMGRLGALATQPRVTH